MRGWYKNKGKEPRFNKPVEVIFNGGLRTILIKPHIFWWRVISNVYGIKCWRYVKES